MSIPTIMEYTNSISMWNIKKIIPYACIVIPLSPGIYIGTSRFLEGTLFTMDEQGLTIVGSVSKIYVDTGVGIINQIHAGWENGNPFSSGVQNTTDAAKQAAKDAAQLAFDAAKNIKNGVVDGIKGAIFIGGLAVVGIVLVNQSKFNWAGIEDRPAKRMKK